MVGMKFSSSNVLARSSDSTAEIVLQVLHKPFDQVMLL